MPPFAELPGQQANAPCIFVTVIGYGRLVAPAADS